MISKWLVRHVLLHTRLTISEKQKSPKNTNYKHPTHIKMYQFKGW